MICQLVLTMDNPPPACTERLGRRILHKKLISGVVAHALASSVESLTVDRPLTQSKNKMAEVTGCGGKMQQRGCKFM